MASYDGLKAWDADGRRLPAAFVVREDVIEVHVDHREARYPVTIDPVAQRAYLKASNTGSNDAFGYAVAVRGDTVVVGAYREESASPGVGADQADNSAADAGAVYVFVRDGSTWSQQAYLKADNAGQGDQFGRSVAISGDTIVVGAPNEDSNAACVNGNGADNSANWAGAGYVFVRSGTAWNFGTYIEASKSEAGDAFGIAVAISNDTLLAGADEDQSGDVGVFANEWDDSAPSAGAAGGRGLARVMGSRGHVLLIITSDGGVRELITYKL